MFRSQLCIKQHIRVVQWKGSVAIAGTGRTYGATQTAKIPGAGDMGENHPVIIGKIMPNNILKVTFKSAESATHVERAKQPHDKM